MLPQLLEHSHVVTHPRLQWYFSQDIHLYLNSVNRSLEARIRPQVPGWKGGKPSSTGLEDVLLQPSMFQYLLYKILKVSEDEINNSELFHEVTHLTQNIFVEEYSECRRNSK